MHCGHLHFFQRNRWLMDVNFSPLPLISNLSPNNIRVAVNLLSSYPYWSSVFPSKVPPLCLPFRGVTWRLLKHFLLWSRAHGLWSSTGPFPLLPSPLANHLSSLSKTPFHLDYACCSYHHLTLFWLLYSWGYSSFVEGFGIWIIVFQVMPWSWVTLLYTWMINSILWSQSFLPFSYYNYLLGPICTTSAIFNSVFAPSLQSPKIWPNASYHFFLF